VAAEVADPSGRYRRGRRRDSRLFPPLREDTRERGTHGEDTDRKANSATRGSPWRTDAMLILPDIKLQVNRSSFS